MNVTTKLMKTIRCFAATLGIGIGFLIPTQIARADDQDNMGQLSARWWQWVFSIPTAQNPTLDATGGSCMIGQRGSVWFLAGNPGGTQTRTCSVPAGLTLFFPVVNFVGVNSPNCGGQGPQSLSVKDIRKSNAAEIDTVKLANLSVELDSEPIYGIERVLSDVFSIALPASNFTGCPAGVYSPGADDGYYVKLNPLKVGPHTLHIQASASFLTPAINVTYHLTIVQVSDQ